MLRAAMISAIALALAGTASAQQQSDPQLRQQAETIYSKWEKGGQRLQCERVRRPGDTG